MKLKIIIQISHKGDLNKSKIIYKNYLPMFYYPLLLKETIYFKWQTYVSVMPKNLQYTIVLGETSWNLHVKRGK